MRIAVIGAGGIGSNLCRDLARAIRAGQLGADIETKDVDVYDFDVVDPSNLYHQDFTGDELQAPKVAVMTVRYGFAGLPIRFVDGHLVKYDTYLICADNAEVRSIIFEHAKAAGKHFVDMRSEGTRIAVFTDRDSIEDLRGSLGKDKKSREGRSCQTAEDVAAGRVQMGNAVVAPLGLQVLLQMFRADNCNPDETFEYPKYIISDIRGCLHVVED